MRQTKTAEEIIQEREKILAIQKEYNLKHGMTKEQAEAQEIVQRQLMAEGPPKQPSITWAIVRFVLGAIGAIIGIYGVWYSYQVMTHLHP